MGKVKDLVLSSLVCFASAWEIKTFHYICYSLKAQQCAGLRHLSLIQESVPSLPAAQFCLGQKTLRSLVSERDRVLPKNSVSKDIITTALNFSTYGHFHKAKYQKM